MLSVLKEYLAVQPSDHCVHISSRREFRKGGRKHEVWEQEKGRKEGLKKLEGKKERGKEGRSNKYCKRE